MSIHAVKLYLLYGVQWVFDDPTKEIWAEAFISGADGVIDDLIKKKYGKVEPEKQYIMLFSNKDFPGSSYVEYQPREGVDDWSEMELVDNGSYWVYNDHSGKDCLIWLCDTLDEYFSKDDKILFFDIKTQD